VRAVLITAFGRRPEVVEVPTPIPAPDGVVVQVRATGLCRSDWHGWLGHDPDIDLPHVPGHEFAGVISAVGADVRGWRAGDRVTAPFVCACGRCAECRAGRGQVCAAQQQPGFTYWGSFAEQVAVPRAETNLVTLPDALDFAAAAALGCRFATAYRALHGVGRLVPRERLIVFGCGGVGLSAVQIAVAAGAQVLAVDPEPRARELALRFGATRALASGPELVEALRESTDGGAEVALDALGSAEIVQSALRSLRPGGRLVQVGLLPGPVTLDMAPLIGRELRWLGSHGMAASDYPPMLAAIESGRIAPASLLGSRITLAEAPDALASLDAGGHPGITVIEPMR
jgi:alcohol dehydrogenase